MELLFTIALVAVLGFAFLGLLFKALIWIVVLPFKIGIWLLQGVIGIFVIVPLVLVGVCAASAAVPIVLGLLALPVIAVVAGLVALVKLF